MISRIVMMTALMAGSALLCLPAQAQTGTSAQSTGGSPTGSVGTTSNTPRDNSSSTSTTMGPMGGGTTNSPGMSSQSTTGAGSARATANANSGMHHAPRQAQAQPRQSGAMRGSNMAERQVTECLNNAAAQNQPLDGCKR